MFNYNFIQDAFLRSDAVRNRIDRFFGEPDWSGIGLAALKILLIMLAGFIVVKMSKRAVAHIVEDREGHRRRLNPRRTKTLVKLVGNIVAYTVNFMVLLLILGQLNIDLAPLLAGAGVVGLAIGFGAQNLVRDVITGFFIIFEDQFGVGDVIQTGNFKGTVEEIGLRVTKIKNWTGEMHIIPNGQITEVTNFSLNNSVAVVDISVAYEADVEKAMEVIRETVHNVYGELEEIVKEPEVLGVQTLGASDVVLRVTAECKPNTHFKAARHLNAQIKKALDANGIEIPYPRLVTYHRNETAGGQ